MNEARKTGLMLFLGAAALSALYAGVATWLSNRGWQPHGIGWFVPAGFMLAGLVQVVSGVPFSQLAARWDSLRGWQRGVLGVLIVILAFLFVAVAGYLWTRL
jgi:hypothetical protein